MEALVEAADSSPPPVRWNSLERQRRSLASSSSLHHQGPCGGSSSTTSLLHVGGGFGDTSSAGRSPPSRSPSGEIHQQLSLLTVPQIHSPIDEPGSSEGTLSPGSLAVATTSSKFRRYSCNPPGKGQGLTSSPQPHLRRSSLAAIKWSVLARRISMGMAHEREPPQDPTQVRKKKKKGI